MRRRLALLAVASLVAFPVGASAQVDPEGCTDEIAFDPAIPTFQEVVGTEEGGTLPGAHGFVPSPHWHQTADLYKYAQAVVQATRTSDRVRVIEKDIGATTLGNRRLKYYVVGTPENIANLDDGRDDAAFWSGVVSGRVSQSTGLAAVRERPAFAWVTATPHGNEPAAGEASLRLLYELAARTDCDNARRLRNLDVFISPARNPDGRDHAQRFTAWGFDPNRDFGTRNQRENELFMPEITKYPGLFFIDAHQQSASYFFPPNEDPVHHEISQFALDLIQNRIGPALQQRFNDQGVSYRNYNTYDLFTPEYGDTVPSLIMGAAGMTFEKGQSESYGKQVYDHYLAMDETVNVVANEKVALLKAWILQWQEAIDQGAACALQPNKLVSPLHTTIEQQPAGRVCGYFYRPGLHTGDVAKLLSDLQSTGVNVYRLDQAVALDGVRELGETDAAARIETLPAGTLYIPMAQPMKHWIQAVLGEDPFIPFAYFYDVVTWSYSLNRGLAGNGVLTKQMPSGVRMTAIGPPRFGTVTAADKPVYAFATDSMAGLGLAIDLLHEGATVYRAADAFDAGGRHFPTGTALVDASTARADIVQLAAKRQTPVYGLDSYPVERFQLRRAKIALYTQGPEPPNPSPTNGLPPAQCMTAFAAQVGAVPNWCPALFTLKVKDGIPPEDIVAVTDAELPTLTARGFTALVNPGVAIQGIGQINAIQRFVNDGGNFVTTGTGGTTAARSAGLTNVSTQTIGGLLTPGTTFAAQVDTSSPVAWGFDEGAWIYREWTSAPVYNPASLAGSGSIPTAKAALRYASPLRAFGYQVNATGSGRLDGRPAVVDQPFGAGHVTLIGFDPFYRAWHESSERFVLNGILYPQDAAVAPGPAGKRAASVGRAPRALPAAQLPRTAPRPVAVSQTDDDVLVAVRPGAASRLRAAVSAASLPRAIGRRVAFVRRGGTVVLTIRNVRTDDFHQRADWVGRLMATIERRRIATVYAQV